jgi:AraC family ethanolamine operon transcriptional activator
MAEIIHSTFTDFEDLAATAKGWNLELSKLDRGSFQGELFQWITDGFILSRGRFSSYLRQEGSPPPGLRTMTVHIRREMAQYWRGRQVKGNDLLIFPHGSEVDTVSDPRFDIFTISFDEDDLLDQADGMGCGSAATRLKEDEVLHLTSRNMDRMRRTLFDVVREVGTGTGDPARTKRNIQAEVIHLLEGARGPGTGQTRRNKRLRTFMSAQEYLKRHAGEAVSVEDVSRAVGTSVRTLQYAFRDYVGMGPKAYINALRLNLVRKNLRSARPEVTRVADVANKLGYWHMGQFAADYRRHFGENPSQTISGSGCVVGKPGEED